jgi:hypothetical protein
VSSPTASNGRSPSRADDLLDRTLPLEVDMILLTFLRNLHAVWMEARQMQREMEHRFPHLRD